MTNDDLHPAIQTAIIRIGNPNLSLADIGKLQGISKQAVKKRLIEAEPHLAAFRVNKSDDAIAAAAAEVARKDELIRLLQQRLVLQATELFMLKCFFARIREFFPKFKLSRLNPFEKKASWIFGRNSSVSAAISKILRWRRGGRLIPSESGSRRF